MPWSRRPRPPACCSRWPATGQLPRILAKVHPVHRVPDNAHPAGRGRLAGRRRLYGRTRRRHPAAVHPCQLRRAHRVPAPARFGVQPLRRAARKPRRVAAHRLAAAGVPVIAYVVVKANVAAQRLGFAWLLVGIIVLVVAYSRGRRPTLAGMTDVRHGGHRRSRERGARAHPMTAGRDLEVVAVPAPTRRSYIGRSDGPTCGAPDPARHGPRALHRGLLRRPGHRPGDAALGRLRVPVPNPVTGPFHVDGRRTRRHPRRALRRNRTRPRLGRLDDVPALRRAQHHPHDGDAAPAAGGTGVACTRSTAASALSLSRPSSDLHVSCRWIPMHGTVGVAPAGFEARGRPSRPTHMAATWTPRSCAPASPSTSGSTHDGRAVRHRRRARRQGEGEAMRHRRGVGDEHRRHRRHRQRRAHPVAPVRERRRDYLDRLGPPA